MLGHSFCYWVVYLKDIPSLLSITCRGLMCALYFEKVLQDGEYGVAMCL